MSKFHRNASIASLFIVCMFVSASAFAQDGTGASTLPPATLAWVSFGGLLVHFLMSLAAPGTQPLPWSLTASQRMYIGAGLSAVAGLLSLLQTGSTFQSAALTSLGTLFTALVAHAPQLGSKVQSDIIVKTVAPMALLLCLGMGASGCALFQSIEKNPVVAATTLVQVLNDADGVATAAFNAAEPLLPASQEAQATADWAKGQTTLQNAEVALEDAAQAYEAGTSQNWGALVTAAKGAFDAVVAILDLYGATLMGASKVALSSPVFATQRAQLALRVAVIHRYH